MFVPAVLNGGARGRNPLRCQCSVSSVGSLPGSLATLSNMPALDRPSPLGGQKGAATVSEQILEPSRRVHAQACKHSSTLRGG